MESWDGTAQRLIPELFGWVEARSWAQTDLGKVNVKQIWRSGEDSYFTLTERLGK